MARRVPAAVLHALAPLRRATHRDRTPARETPLLETSAPRPNPWLQSLTLAAVVLLGAWLGLLVVGNVRAPVGPMNTTMALRPSLTGGTKINVSPLGALELVQGGNESGQLVH